MTAVRISEAPTQPFYTPKTLAQLLQVSERNPVELQPESEPATGQRPGSWPTRLERDDMAKPTYPPPIERFWAKVDKDGPVPGYAPHLGPCWIWTAGVTDGYGIFWVTKHIKAHRFSYELLVGPIPARLQLDHLCRVRRCVNPAHLEPVTKRENQRRAPAKTHCPQGHPYTGDNLFLDSRGSRCCLRCSRDQTRESQRRRRAARRDPRLGRMRDRQLLVLRLLGNGPQTLQGLMSRSPGLELYSASAVVSRLRRLGFVERVGREGRRALYALTLQGDELLAANLRQLAEGQGRS